MSCSITAFGELLRRARRFLSVHDKDKDGYLTKDEMLQLSESLLFIFRNEIGDHYLAAVSRVRYLSSACRGTVHYSAQLMQNAFEYAEAIKEEQSPTPNDTAAAKEARRRSGSVAENPHRPYISLATLRMVVLADEVLESFFLTDLTASWRLVPQPEPTQPVSARSAAGFFGGLASTVNSLLTDEHKERFNRLADEVGKRLDIQSVEQRPSIGKIDAGFEPKTRESLFTPSPNPNHGPSPAHSPPLVRSPSFDPLSAAAMRIPAEGLAPASPALPPTPSGLAYQPREKRPASSAMSAALTTVNQLPERQAFVIDEAGDEAGEDVDAGEEVMDEVDAFLKENDGET